MLRLTLIKDSYIFKARNSLGKRDWFKGKFILEQLWNKSLIVVHKQTNKATISLKETSVSKQTTL